MSAEPLAVTISGDGSGELRAEPQRLLIDASDFGLDDGATGHLRLTVDSGWRVEPVGPLRWALTPEMPALDWPTAAFLTFVGQGRRSESIEIAVRLDLRSGLDVAGCALPLPNRASALGDVEPTRAIFDQTFIPMPEPLNRLLFEGLYSDIVYLRSQGASRGGLCSGIAHWTLERSLGREPRPFAPTTAVERVAMFHGRQLRDSALLASLPWFLRGSSRAVFRAVRRDLLKHGVTDRAIDVDIPKLWRRDIATAIVKEGHVVVPYRLRQDGPGHGEIEVYDPNAPDAVASGEPRVIRFDLARDRYAYVHRVSMDDSNVGMIAVRQKAYSGRGTAFIALLGSLLLTPRRGLRSLLGKRDSART